VCDLSECTLLTNEGIKTLPVGIKNISLRGIPNLTDQVFNELVNLKDLETLDLSQCHMEFNRLSKTKQLNLKKLFFYSFGN